MFRLLTAVFLFASLNAVAQTQVPNVFEDGTPATAAEVNANFDALETAIDAIPEGPAGPAGAKGDTGDTGPQGEKGDTGDQGIQGEQGPQGLAGNNGVQGDKGDTGDTGPQGPIGLTGATGATGAKGDTGDQGAPGNDGQDGADGVAAGLSCTTDQIIKWDGSAWVCSSLQRRLEYYSAPLPQFATANCPIGTKVTGGGCNIEGGDCSVIFSKPRSDLSGWDCQAYSGTDCSGVREVYAVCQ